MSRVSPEQSINRGWSARLLALAIAAIFLSDVLSTQIDGGLMRGVVYGLAALGSYTVVALGAYAVFMRRMHVVLAALWTLYAVLIAAQLLRWLSHISLQELPTIAAHPSFSAGTWLMAGLVPVAYRYVADVGLPPFSQLQVFAAALLAVAASISAAFSIGLYLPAFILFALITSLLVEGKGWSLFLALTTVVACATISYTAGYRSYALLSAACVLMLLVPPPNRIASLVLLVCFLSIPTATSTLYEFARGYSEAWGINLGPNTRTLLVSELFADMSPYQMLFGKGLDGTYFSPYFYLSQSTNPSLKADHYIRYGSEIGVLNHILKVGFLGLVAFLALLLAPLALRTQPRDQVAARLRRVLLAITLLFTIELPLAADVGFALWYLASGALYARTLLSRRMADQIEAGK